MKKRFGHVTNSSSSSFIIAKNDKCTVEEIKNSILDNKELVKEMFELFDENCEEYTIEEFADDLALSLFRVPDLKLDNWMVGSTYYSSEDEIDSAFVYDYGHKLSTDNFKVQCGNY